MASRKMARKRQSNDLNGKASIAMTLSNLSVDNDGGIKQPVPIKRVKVTFALEEYSTVVGNVVGKANVL